MGRFYCEHLWPDDADTPCPECEAEAMPWRAAQDTKDLRIQTLEHRVLELEHELRSTQRQLSNARIYGGRQ